MSTSKGIYNGAETLVMPVLHYTISFALLLLLWVVVVVVVAAMARAAATVVVWFVKIFSIIINSWVKLS